MANGITKSAGTFLAAMLRFEGANPTVVIPKLNQQDLKLFGHAQLAMTKKFQRDMLSAIKMIDDIKPLIKVNESFLLETLRRTYAFLDKENILMIQALMSARNASPHAIGLMSSLLRTHNLNIARRIQAEISPEQQNAIQALMKRDQIIYGRFTDENESERAPLTIVRKQIHNEIVTRIMLDNPDAYQFDITENGIKQQLNAAEYLEYLNRQLPDKEQQNKASLFKHYEKSFAPLEREDIQNDIDSQVENYLNTNQDKLPELYQAATKNLSRSALKANPSVTSAFQNPAYLSDPEVSTITLPDNPYLTSVDPNQLRAAGLKESDSYHNPVDTKAYFEKILKMDFSEAKPNQGPISQAIHQMTGWLHSHQGEDSTKAIDNIIEARALLGNINSKGIQLVLSDKITDEDKHFIEEMNRKLEDPSKPKLSVSSEEIEQLSNIISKLDRYGSAPSV